MSLRDKFNSFLSVCVSLEPRYKAAFAVGTSAWALRTGFQVVALVDAVREAWMMDEFSFSALFNSPTLISHAQNLAVIWPVTKITQWTCFAYGATGFIPKKPDPV